MPVSDYVDNPIFQGLPDQETYFSAQTNERNYLDLKASSEYVKKQKNLKEINLK